MPTIALEASHFSEDCCIYSFVQFMHVVCGVRNSLLFRKLLVGHLSRALDLGCESVLILDRFELLWLYWKTCLS
jgi:hypothetical protein